MPTTPPGTPKKLPMGIVLEDLPSYQQLVHTLTGAYRVSAFEFTYRAPLFKATETIRARLVEARSALEKFDVYFEEAILNEEVRVQLAQQFRQDFIRRHPASEATDLYKASGDVMVFAFELRPPHESDDPIAARLAVQAHPHDTAVLAEWVKNRRVDKVHLHGEIRMYLDHVFNPRRREVVSVQRVMTGNLAKEPVVVELYTSGALPGYFVHELEPIVHHHGGELVWLPG